jgi:hypothetical protein
MFKIKVDYITVHQKKKQGGEPLFGSKHLLYYHIGKPSD